MNDTLKWIHPTGAHIIDAMLFTQAQEAENGIIERHRHFVEQIHANVKPPSIMLPYWYITLREPTHPFMVAYPLGCDSKQPYNVRLTIDEIMTHPIRRNHVYVMSMDIRYNGMVATNRRYHTLMHDRYENAQDFVSLAASAQSTFHRFFKEQTDDPEFLMNPSLYDSVSDYSSQPCILPAYNTHLITKGAS
jgi:hypothetical protein